MGAYGLKRLSSAIIGQAFANPHISEKIGARDVRPFLRKPFGEKRPEILA